jgi:hypothetical protein
MTSGTDKPTTVRRNGPYDWFDRYSALRDGGGDDAHRSQETEGQPNELPSPVIGGDDPGHDCQDDPNCKEED